MTTKGQKHIPSLRLHRPSGRGYVELNRNRQYLGPFDDPETRLRYERIVSEWLIRNRRPDVSKSDITVVELLDRFWIHANAYYRKPDGTPTTSISCFRMALKPLKRLYGLTRVAEFGPMALKVVRQGMIDADMSRRVVNQSMVLIRSVFRWGVAEEFIPESVPSALATIAPLRRGRSDARETDLVKPVPQAHVDAIQQHVASQVWALIQLQLFTGARAGELVTLRPVDFDTTGKVWTAELREHKTAYHGRIRTIYFGPRAQAVVGEFLPGRAVDAYLFSPRAGGAERSAVGAKSHRRPGQPQTPRKTKRRVGDHYTTTTYRRAISRGCEAAKVHVWTPHQLRHSAATMLRKEFGVEAAQLMLGHAKADVTQLYAEVNRAKAVEVAAKIG